MLIAEKGSGYISQQGYRLVYTPDGRYLPEHRYVLEKVLGRALEPQESVHHKNGDRSDNNLLNLELWSKDHPPGQRVADLVKWAKKILAKYGTL
jgi:hypothetical protein